MNDFFWLTVSCIKGIGDKTVLKLYEKNPKMQFEDIAAEIRAISKKIIVDAEVLQLAKKKAENLIKMHEEKNINVIPISSENYPRFLKLISDPPAVLYAKGNIELLKEEKNVAIVGTREPTTTGVASARKIASVFVERGYVIVSGLALGIDTAGHEGAIRVKGGKTIAVLAGDLTQIYPAKNKKLASEILQNDGLWLSETPIGSMGNRGNFVKRDRIQSGLSIGVCPVQTPITSGTQHTIQFAKEQQRPLFTPMPLTIDANENAVQGNFELIKEGVLVLENKEGYNVIEEAMLTCKEKLVADYRKRFEVKKVEKETKQIDIFNI